MSKPIIPIFFTADDNYIPFLAVSLYSLEQNANRNYKYVIKILHASNISINNQERLLEEFSSKDFNVEFVDITPAVESFADKLHTRDYYSKATYYRLLIPEMYPEYDKGLYLDSDIVINGSISDLFNHDIGDNYVGAIPDQSVLYMSDEFKAYVENRIGMKSYKEYFNAGILLMNLKKLREIHFEDIFIKLLGRVKFDVAQDQDYLNTICKGHVFFISESWNQMPLPIEMDRPECPNLIHYNLSFKPWQIDVIYQDYFWNYAKGTSFYNEIVYIRNSYTEEMKQKTMEVTAKLIESTRIQAADTAENQRIASIVNEVLNTPYEQKRKTVVSEAVA